jgi:hypothetical protein
MVKQGNIGALSKVRTKSSQTCRVPKEEGDMANGIPPKTEFMRAMKELNDLDDKKRRIRFSPRNMACVMVILYLIWIDLKWNE